MTTTVADRVSRRAGGLRARAATPVDGASLAVLRISIGALIAWEVWREFDLGFMRADYLEPIYHFRWWLFEWVEPLPETWFFAAFFAVIAAGLCVALGFFYRPAAIVQFVGFTYLFLLEKARYLNHRYLACLFAFLLVVIPADATYSIDARRRRSVQPGTVPAWSLWLLRFQVGVPYFFAGIAKLNFDWLVRGEPLRLWLSGHTSFPIVGRYFTSDLVVHFFAYASTALDLSVPFFLLHKRTRAGAYGFALLFHFLNSRLFNIGMFPWMMILATTIFFEPDWPREMVAAVRSGKRSVRALVASGFVLGFLVGGFLPLTFSAVKAFIGGIGVAVLTFHVLPEGVRTASAPPRPTADARNGALSRVLVAFLVIWVAVQVVLPLRHFAIPGNAHWTEEGNRFAWHMLLHHKEGTARFQVAGTGVERFGPLGIDQHLADFQIRKMIEHPELLVQFAQYLEDFYHSRGVKTDVEISVETSISLNGRPRQLMIDPGVDLTRIKRPYLPPADWIEPLRDYR